jgi:hypothetical protein
MRRALRLYGLLAGRVSANLARIASRDARAKAAIVFFSSETFSLQIARGRGAARGRRLSN